MANYKRSTKVWTIIMVMVIGLFGAGCLLNERDTDLSLPMRKDGEVAQDSLKANPESDINTESIGGSEETTQPAGDPLKQLVNQQFSIQGENLSKEDDETIVEFGKAFINLFNGAVAKQQKVSFETYISNKNLRKFADKMLELTQQQDLQGGNAINYGFEHEFEQSRLQHVGDNLCYLELRFEFEGSGMGSQMLITTENKSLKLVDFYFGSKDGVDTYATGHPAERQVNNPNLWENKEWVKGVFDKLEDFEEKLGYEGNKSELMSPPTLKVLYQDKSIDAVLGTYSWTINNNDGTETVTDADSVGPTELVNDATLLTVPPKSAITLNFSDEPKDITVNIWQENKPIEQLVTDSKVMTPELKGSVIYEVVATWKQGIAHYAFLVDVN